MNIGEFCPFNESCHVLLTHFKVVLCQVSNILAIVFAKVVDLCKKRIEKLPIKLVWKRVCRRNGDHPQ
jgi:hypothetical protein